MPSGFLDIAITPAVRDVQSKNGVDHIWRDFKGDRQFDRFTENDAAFIAERDSFYMATVSETGWPYVQHRGGPSGFLKVINEKKLAFADYRGNMQFISVGNLSATDRACLFLMDYRRRARLKIYVHVETKNINDDPELASVVLDQGYRAKAERIIVMHLDAFDWNCPQHITPRFSESEIAMGVEPMRQRLIELEAENAALKARLDPLLAG
jgi:predicted pyridoxine 5'-phosphate oxidase superfamily flavin-nucleotide-binding protein